MEELEDMACSGLMQLPTVQTVIMALRHLRLSTAESQLETPCVLRNGR